MASRNRMTGKLLRAQQSLARQRGGISAGMVYVAAIEEAAAASAKRQPTSMAAPSKTGGVAGIISGRRKMGENMQSVKRKLKAALGVAALAASRRGIISAASAAKSGGLLQRRRRKSYASAASGRRNSGVISAERLKSSDGVKMTR